MDLNSLNAVCLLRVAGEFEIIWYSMLLTLVSFS